MRPPGWPQGDKSIPTVSRKPRMAFPAFDYLLTASSRDSPTCNLVPSPYIPPPIEGFSWCLQMSRPRRPYKARQIPDAILLAQDFPLLDRVAYSSILLLVCFWSHGVDTWLRGTHVVGWRPSTKHQAQTGNQILGSLLKWTRWFALFHLERDFRSLICTKYRANLSQNERFLEASRHLQVILGRWDRTFQSDSMTSHDFPWPSMRFYLLLQNPQPPCRPQPLRRRTRLRRAGCTEDKTLDRSTVCDY